MNKKKFKRTAESFESLVTGMGACIATNKIVVEGYPVGFMYKEQPDFSVDSGWRFFSGTEDQNYMDDPNNSGIYDVNTIANYDQSILPYLNLPIGTELERSSISNEFVPVANS